VLQRVNGTLATGTQAHTLAPQILNFFPALNPTRTFNGSSRSELFFLRYTHSPHPHASTYPIAATKNGTKRPKEMGNEKKIPRLDFLLRIVSTGRPWDTHWSFTLDFFSSAITSQNTSTFLLSSPAF